MHPQHLEADGHAIDAAWPCVYSERPTMTKASTSRKLALIALLASAGFSACGGSGSATTATTAPYVSTTAGAVAQKCTPGPQFDYIIRTIAPGDQWSATKIGNAGPDGCDYLDPSAQINLVNSSPKAKGYCTQVARATDNPGYNTDATPAPPLHKVIAQVGDAC